MFFAKQPQYWRVDQRHGFQESNLSKNVRSYQATASDIGLRVDRFLAEKATDLTRMAIGNLIAAGSCLVNGETSPAGRHLSAGDSVELTVEEQSSGAMVPDPIPLEILFEDDHLLVVVKPAGMLVHPTLSVKRGTLANALTFHLNSGAEGKEPIGSVQEKAIRPGIVHRLDRATSGLMVIAKNQRALSILSQHFSRRLVEKCYVALVRGRIDPDDGTIEAPIGRDPEAVPHWRVLAAGRPAETRFTVTRRFAENTLVELTPVTGRTNQLRIHMAHVGHPIVGDASWDKMDESANEGERPSRLCLHASRLGFHHPSGGEWLEFKSAAPLEFDSFRV